MRSYEFSKLRKFLTMTRFTMEDTLRFLVEESLARFVSFVVTACPPKVSLVQCMFFVSFVAISCLLEIMYEGSGAVSV